MTRMTTQQELRREMIENAMGRIGAISIDQEQLDLRIKQAIHRDPSLRSLLEPVMDLTRAMMKNARAARNELGLAYLEYRKAEWK